MIIDRVYEQSSGGFRWESRRWEGLDYFPIDEPLVDLFAFGQEDGARYFICPCGDSLEFPELLGEAVALAREHIERKHPGKVTW